jgi:hypothetical protein
VAGIWTEARRRAASARMKAHHGEITAVRWSDARRAAHAAAVRRAHAEGRYDGAPLGRPRQRPYWPTAREARERVDRVIRGRRVTTTPGEQRHHAILTGPLWELWAHGGTASANTVTAESVDPTLRVRQYRPERPGGVIADWSGVHAARHRAELAQLVAGQRADQQVAA